MKTRSYITLFALVTIIAGVVYAQSSDKTESLAGKVGSSSQWGSGWLVLNQPTDFKEGDCLKITLGGTAKKVMLRLLPKGEAPESSTGIVGGPLDIPQGRTIEVKLSESRLQVIQISVHGGPNPWGNYPLGDDNGPATIASASIVRAR